MLRLPVNPYGGDQISHARVAKEKIMWKGIVVITFLGQLLSVYISQPDELMDVGHGDAALFQIAAQRMDLVGTLTRGVMPIISVLYTNNVAAQLHRITSMSLDLNDRAEAA